MLLYANERCLMSLLGAVLPLVHVCGSIHVDKRGLILGCSLTTGTQLGEAKSNSLLHLSDR